MCWKMTCTKRKSNEEKKKLKKDRERNDDNSRNEPVKERERRRFVKGNTEGKEEKNKGKWKKGGK